MEDHVIYLGLGSNLGNRLNNLKAAVNNLTPQLNVLAKSPIYETPPIGYTEQPPFLNQSINL
jgi:2-amino-4-hydroxy-6-hydroxymethyldihydropteridine diphosphokinase